MLYAQDALVQRYEHTPIRAQGGADVTIHRVGRENIRTENVHNCCG